MAVDKFAHWHVHNSLEVIARPCRAAMLQGADGNSPVIQDGWVACSERMPETDGNYWGWWSESKRQGPVWFIKSDLQAQFQSSEVTHWSHCQQHRSRSPYDKPITSVARC